MTIWQPGMRCVCIKQVSDEARDAIPEGIWPDKGGVYTVREVRDDKKPSGGLTVLLHEIDNSHLIGRQFKYGFGHAEPGFPETGFRPLSETRLDQFRQHLAPQPREEVPA